MPDSNVLPTVTGRPNDLEAFWMPFTANRAFKAAPRMFESAEGMYYRTTDGRQVLDAVAGLWCVNAGHGRRQIVEAIQAEAGKLDYASVFQMGHPLAFEAATKVAAMAPDGFDHVFFANSGSEAVDTALKIALAYHRVKGDAARTRLIGRERGYHGVGFGGISVGGMSNNRKHFATAMLPGVDHLRHTHDLEHNAYSKGQPAWGAHLADDLERLVALHDPSTIAAVIVEPVAGSTGVLVPPQGYLQKLRQICDKYGILLIFDEVITGFGRLGKSFASEYFGVKPDMFTAAKGITNGSVPMGAVVTQGFLYDAFMNAAPEGAIELFHGYTYSAHPLAAAACVATLDLYRSEDLFARGASMTGYFEEAVHSLRGHKHVIDIRNLGLIGGIELEPRAGKPGTRAFDVFLKCFEKGVNIRTTGDIIALSPPLIIEKSHIDQIVGTIAEALAEVE